MDEWKKEWRIEWWVSLSNECRRKKHFAKWNVSDKWSNTYNNDYLHVHISQPWIGAHINTGDRWWIA